MRLPAHGVLGQWIRSAALVFALALASRASAAQEPSGARGEEIVVNLAAGRVVIAVVKDAMVIGTVEDPIESETRPPTPTVLGSTRVCIVLGADEWVSPGAHREVARLSTELPRLRSRMVSSSPHLEQAQEGTEASDIESVGQALLERLNQVASLLHGRVDLPLNEPITELVIADYLPGYGPEAWQLTYEMKQEEEKDDYWSTRVLRPVYLQFWPPEKGQPRTLIEFSYPPENAPPSLLDLLRQNDNRLESIEKPDAKMAEVAGHFLAGESNKVMAVDAVQFLRAALAAVSTPQARQTMILIGRESGIQWILAPPSEPVRPGTEETRPSDAPSLMKPPSSR
jgi:hypothetical protein